MSERSFGYRPSLDGLRALAVIAVLAFHTGLVPGGWVGVDVFFALSGFLITGLLAAEGRRSGTISLRAFWRRRFRRLLPALGMLLAVVVVLDLLHSILASTTWRPPTGGELLGTIVYGANWQQLYAGHGYWALFAAPNPLAHMWSLAVEEQFYVVWPVLFALLWRWGARPGRRQGQDVVVAGGAAVLALGSLAAQLLLTAAGASNDRVYLGTDTRAAAFFLGAFAALVIDQHLVRYAATGSPRRSRTLDAVVAAAVAALAVATVTVRGDDGWLYRGGLFALSLIGATAVTAAAATGLPRSLVRRALECAPVRSIGRWSYGIYLFHWPIVMAVGVHRWRPAVRFGVVTAVASLVAAASYHLLENPIRSGRLRVRLRVALVVAAIVIGANLTRTVSLEPRDPVLSTAQALAPVPSSTAATDDMRRVLVLGDSVEAGLADEWAARTSSRLQVIVRAAPACRPSPRAEDQIRDDTRAVCAAIIGQFPEDLRSFAPSDVVLHYGSTFTTVTEAGAGVDTCTDTGKEVVVQQLLRLVEPAIAARARVWLVLPNNSPDAFGLVDPVELAAAGECAREAMRELAVRSGSAPVTVVPLDEYICPGGEVGCSGVVDGVQTRDDGIHFSTLGEPMVIDFILGAITAP